LLVGIGGKFSSTVIPATEPESRKKGLYRSFWMPLAQDIPGLLWLDLIQGPV